SAPGDSSAEKDTWREAVDRGPTPEEAALLVETLQETMRGMEERERQIIQLGLLGDTDKEIGKETGRTQYTVRQVRKSYAATLQELNDRDEEKQASEPEERPNAAPG